MEIGPVCAANSACKTLRGAGGRGSEERRSEKRLAARLRPHNPELVIRHRQQANRRAFDWPAVDDALVRTAIGSLVRLLGFVAHTFESAECFLSFKESTKTSCIVTDIQCEA